MGIKQTLAVIGLSTFAFSSAAEAQSNRAQTPEHCMTGVLNIAVVAEKLFAQPLDKWDGQFLSSIGQKNIDGLIYKANTSLQRDFVVDIRRVGDRIYKGKMYDFDWKSLKDKTHFSLHDTLVLAQQNNWNMNTWHSKAYAASVMHTGKIIEKLTTTPQAQLGFCPTITTPVLTQ